MALFNSPNKVDKRKEEEMRKRVEEQCAQLHPDDPEKQKACVIERTERLRRFF